MSNYRRSFFVNLKNFRTEALFLKTIYAGPMIDQVMMLNKRNYQESYNKRKKEREDTKIKKSSEGNNQK